MRSSLQEACCLPLGPEAVMFMFSGDAGFSRVSGLRPQRIR